MGDTVGQSVKLLPPAFVNHRAGDGWAITPVRLERWGLLWRKRIWEFRLLYPNPLAFRDADGNLWQPDRHEAETDLGSSPPPIRGLFPQDEFPLSFIFHDSAWRKGGLWRNGEWVPLPRMRSNRMLRDDWIPAEVRLSGGSNWRRWPVYAGVQIGALIIPR